MVIKRILMKLNSFRTLFSAVTVAIILNLANIARPAAAATISLMGLTDNNTLISFNPENPNQVKTVRVTGVDGMLIGIDMRSSDGLLYGITDTNHIYVIDPTTGAATLKSTLNLGFAGGEMSGVDFNPVPDRLRLVGDNDQNYRSNVDTGMVADFDPKTDGLQTDRNLTYGEGDAHAGADPHITAVAYTNSFFGPPSPQDVTPPTRTTQLFGIDAELDVLVLQAPPNDGVLKTVGPLGVDFCETGGFDILSPKEGENIAFAASDSMLYTVDLSNGSTTPLGTIGDGSVHIMGLTAAIAP
ncbi:MAG: DUF4394 domain-containing protein [Leptolyngbyaceae cyanobacterium CRU_2_3]|nr:DUF4394 domain-containing protein [Leptolyngbyaceae cyanobacterium CRU_2_3]